MPPILKIKRQKMHLQKPARKRQQAPMRRQLLVKQAVPATKAN